MSDPQGTTLAEEQKKDASGVLYKQRKIRLYCTSMATEDCHPSLLFAATDRSCFLNCNQYFRGLWARWDEGIPASCVADLLTRHAATGGVIVGWELHGDLEVIGFEQVTALHLYLYLYFVYSDINAFCHVILGDVLFSLLDELLYAYTRRSSSGRLSR